MAFLFCLWLITLHYSLETYGNECAPKCGKGEMLWFRNDNPVFVYNGCGIDYLSITSDVLDPCCMEHDACMKICGTDADMCDETFRICTDNACRTGWNMHKDACRFASTITHAVLNSVSCDFFYQEQDDYCKCIPIKAAKKKLARNIKWFYGRINRGKLINTKKKLRRRVKYLSSKDWTSGNSENWKATNWLLDLIEKHPYKLIKYNGKSTFDGIKKGWNKVKTFAKTGWTSVTRNVKSGWDKTKKHIENGVDVLKKKVESGWDSIKKGWNSLFGAHDDLYDEYQQFEADIEKENVDDKTEENMEAAELDVGLNDAQDEMFVLIIIISFVFIILCGLIGYFCGFVVASRSTKSCVHFY